MSYSPTQANSDVEEREQSALAALHASNEPQDVLRILPENTEARRAFDGVVELQKSGDLSDDHAQYLAVTGSGKTDFRIDQRERDETTDEASSDDQSSSHMQLSYNGYFRVGFDSSTVSEGLERGRLHMSIGRGSGKKFGPTRNVDILLAAPKSKAARPLRSTHILLRIHGRSGAWLVTAAAEMMVEDATLHPNEIKCLYRPRTRIQIADLQYTIQFVDETPIMEQVYVEKRNKAFQSEGLDFPATKISGIPMQHDIILPTIVFRHGLGSGTFGNVFEGVEPDDGDLRVAKRITLRSKNEEPALRAEIKALERFGGREGLLKLIEWRTSLGDRNFDVPQYPVDVYLVHEKGIAFNQVDWRVDFPNWKLRRSLCRQLLKGLEMIHQEQCMHRDITPMNILFFPFNDPPQAVLCDFGKFCEQDTATTTRLAAWKFLPPELQRDKENPYNQALDIWMLGLALTYCWWPESMNLEPRNKHDHKRMQQILLGDSGCAGLGNLIARMMYARPDRRPMAASALAHYTFHGLSNEDTPVKTSETKRTFAS
ncbi:MAG: hypothetical protein Q9220_000120 [cf. Caloplaca sp. 1 TL-2023]